MSTYAYIIPAILVFLSSILITALFFRNEDKKRQQEIRMKNSEQVLPLRLQAYERLVLLLERISLENLLIRIQHPGMSVKQLQVELLSSIRQEFDHNIAQQVYVSSELWTKITEAKELLVKEINTTVIELKPDAPAMELSKALLGGLHVTNDVKSTRYAIGLIKKELRLLF